MNQPNEEGFDPQEYESDDDVIQFERPGASALEASAEVPETAGEEPAESEEPQKRPKGNREPMPAYDPEATRPQLYKFADEAAAQRANMRRQEKEAELARLPQRIPSEEELLRMSEGQRTAFTAALARSERIRGEMASIDEQYRSDRAALRATSDAIISAQKSVLAAYPNDAAEILDAAMNIVNNTPPSDELNDMLRNPEFYTNLRRVILGQRIEKKEARAAMRRKAEGAQLAGRSSGVNAPRNFQKPSFTPSQLREKLDKWGFGDDAIKDSLNRRFPGVA